MTVKNISKQIKNICFGVKNPKQTRGVGLWESSFRIAIKKAPKAAGGICNALSGLFNQVSNDGLREGEAYHSVVPFRKGIHIPGKFVN